MNELHSILEAWRGLQGEHRSAVLASVVHVSGSAYRRPGARMLLLPDGKRIGSVSGGCLEGELAKKAWWLTESGEPSVRVYDTTSDDDAVWEFGLGCNGVVQVMLERVETPAIHEALTYLDARRDSPVVMATLVRVTSAAETHYAAGSRVFFDGERCGQSGLALLLWEDLRLAWLERRSRYVHVAGLEVFVEWLGPPQKLVIFGAGHDARPLVSISKQLGWHVTIADGRPAYACAANFPDADRVVLFRAEAPLRGLSIDEDTAVVLMTHNYPLDLRLLPAVLAHNPRYVGVLGPKNRAERLLDECGLAAPENLHAPAGLDVGGEAPAAVALSITAEIQAVLMSRKGGELRLREGSLHAPVLEVGRAEFRPLAAQPAYCELNG